MNQVARRKDWTNNGKKYFFWKKKILGDSLFLVETNRFVEVARSSRAKNEVIYSPITFRL